MLLRLVRKPQRKNSAVISTKAPALRGRGAGDSRDGAWSKESADEVDIAWLGAARRIWGRGDGYQCEGERWRERAGGREAGQVSARRCA